MEEPGWRAGNFNSPIPQRGNVLTDLFGSSIAILSGISAYFLGWLWVDPLASMILSILVLKSGIGTFRLALKDT